MQSCNLSADLSCRRIRSRLYETRVLHRARARARVRLTTATSRNSTSVDRKEHRPPRRADPVKVHCRECTFAEYVVASVSSPRSWSPGIPFLDATPKRRSISADCQLSRIRDRGLFTRDSDDSRSRATRLDEGLYTSQHQSGIH
jgi:hypothetical protein